MKVSTFFKILNKKIEKYERMTTNPFTIPQPIVLIWLEESEENFYPKLDNK
jgi:hypothetical protein